MSDGRFHQIFMVFSENLNFPLEIKKEILSKLCGLLKKPEHKQIVYYRVKFGHSEMAKKNLKQSPNLFDIH